MLYGADSDGRKRFWLLIDVFGVTRGSLYFCVTACEDGAVRAHGHIWEQSCKRPSPLFASVSEFGNNLGERMYLRLTILSDCFRIIAPDCARGKERGSIRKSREATPLTANTRVLRSLMNI